MTLPSNPPHASRTGDDIVLGASSQGTGAASPFAPETFPERGCVGVAGPAAATSNSTSAIGEGTSRPQSGENVSTAKVEQEKTKATETSSISVSCSCSEIPLSLEKSIEAVKRKQLVERVKVLRDAGASWKEVENAIGTSYSTARRWYLAEQQGGLHALQPKTHLCGRKPNYLPTEAELAYVRSIYVRLNESEVRGRGLGSSVVTAYRLAAKSEEACISEDFRATVLKQRSTKTVPPSWRRLLQTPASVLAKTRDESSTMTVYISTPRGPDYVDINGEVKPLRAGTIFESDDGTVNFPVWVPWPYGGDKCSDKFGVKIGRFQLLPIVDRRTRFCPFFHFIIRSKSSYRGEDIVQLFGSAFSEIGIPEALCLERGSWESNLVKAALQLSGTQVLRAWESKQKNAVENFFDRLWAPLSLLPGDVGRFRGEHKENTGLVQACEDGRRDPRDYFLSVEQATKAISNSVAFVNSEPVESRTFGKWIPQEMWIQQTNGGVSIPRLDPSLKVFFSREQRVWTVRAGCVGGRVATPMLEFPVYFQAPELWEFEGCKVKCFFDPFTEPVLGTIVLVDEWRGYKPNTVIVRDFPALDLPPQAVLAADYKRSGEHEQSLRNRKAMAKAVRTEAWSWLGKRTSEARDGFGNSVRVQGEGEGERERANTKHQNSNTEFPSAYPKHRTANNEPIRRAELTAQMPGNRSTEPLPAARRTDATEELLQRAARKSAREEAWD